MFSPACFSSSVTLVLLGPGFVSPFDVPRQTFQARHGAVETRPEPAPEAEGCVAAWLAELPAEEEALPADEATPGEEVPPEVVPLERCSNMNHVAISIASASRATRAIWKGREIWAINTNFGIRAAGVEPQNRAWTTPTAEE